MNLDPQHCYAALQARDVRFDGLFFVAVSTTRIYCRPICTVRLPGADRCTYYPNAAMAEQAGYRPCLKCRPELAPGAAVVDSVQRVARQAAARIAEGALTDSSLDALAASFGLSSRQLRRTVEREFGVPPIALAQTYRLLLAKQLLTDTALPITDIAFASGFASVRRFNHCFRSQYRLNPGALRRQQVPTPPDRGIGLRLAYRPPLAWDRLVAFLIARGSARIEHYDGTVYRRTLRLGRESGWISAQPLPGKNQLWVQVAPNLLSGLNQLLPAIRRLFDLDANPAVIEASLCQDPQLAGYVTAASGLRVPGALEGFELALRAVLGQQISVKAATTLFGRFVNQFGEPLQTPFTGLDRLPPTAAAIADASLQQLVDQGLTGKRAATLHGLARAIADRRITLDSGDDPEQVMQALQELPGIGPWTAHYIAMRALSAPDAFPHADLALLRAMQLQRGAQLLSRAEAWRPWRAYAALHIWNSLNGGG
ncbi:MAG: AlkA N-terminal domain-containing protein [Pseudomonas sp.]|uniref:AlkA N-terminal domain-containing protein n=1 Tax=Pseudomonas sp. TaxID=306 RepID=UPI0033913206